MRIPKILICEDDSASLLLLKTTAKKFTTDIITAVNGKIGLDLYKEHKPDLIITDIGMPIMDGLEMTREIKKINPIQRIIINSAFDDKTTLLKAIDAKVSNYLTKPINVSQVRDKIEDEINLIQLEQQVITQSEEIDLLSKAVESSSSMILIMDKDFNTIYSNSSVEKNLGYSTSYLRDNKIILCFEEAGDLKSYNEFLGTKVPDSVWKGEFSIKKENGKEIHVSSTISPIFGDNNEVQNYIEVLDDVTEKHLVRAQLEESNEFLESEVRKRTSELENALEKAESANKAKSLFLAKVSHELRTPLNGILGMTSVLIGNENDPDNKRKLQIVESSGDSLLKLINDLIDYSQIQSDNLKLENKPVNFKHTIYDTTAILEPLADQKKLELKVNYDDDLQEEYLIDRLRIRQIITNLTNNAIKFTEKGSVVVNIKLIESNVNLDQIQVEISDTGIGIPKEKQHKLFQSFSQVDNNLSRKYGGTGLGLAITKDLVEKMNGRIELESEEGTGTSVSVFIGLEKTSEELVDKNQLSNIIEILEDNQDLTDQILIAEDSAINLTVFNEVLNRSNLRVDYAENGLEAYQLAKTKPYSVVFLDIQMPVMDGYEAGKKIIDGSHSDAVYALTANNEKDIQSKCFQIGFKDILLKPIKWEYFFKKIRDRKEGESNNDEIADITELLNNINYNEKVLAKLVDSFINGIEHSKKRLSEGVKNSDNKEIYAITHKLKSELGNFSASKSLSFVKLLNNKAENSNTAISFSEIEDLLNALDELADWLSKIELDKIKNNAGEV